MTKQFHVPTHVFNSVTGATYHSVTIWVKEDFTITVNLIDRKSPSYVSNSVKDDRVLTKEQVYEMGKLIGKDADSLKKLSMLGRVLESDED